MPACTHLHSSSRLFAGTRLKIENPEIVSKCVQLAPYTTFKVAQHHITTSHNMAFKRLNDTHAFLQLATRMTREQNRALVYANYYLEPSDAEIEVIDVDAETACE